MNTQRRRARALDASLWADFEEQYFALMDCLSAGNNKALFYSLLRRVWDFSQEIGMAPSDLVFPVDLFPDTAAARESLAKFDHAVFENPRKVTLAESRRLDARFIETIQAWLREHPDARRLLDAFRRL